MRLFVDNLTVIDFSYLHPEYGVEGESWICDAQLSGGLDSQSMVMDFGLVKKQLKREIDRLVDHCLIVPTLSPSLESINYYDAEVVLTWRGVDNMHVIHRSVPDALCLIENKEVSIDSVAAFLQCRLTNVVNETVKEIKITLRPEKIDGPYYHYSHGLKKHDGNCQRIAHGHRSRIEIFKNGELDVALMGVWATKWKHVYIGSQEDVVNCYEQGGRHYLSFQYQAEQGEFFLDLPQDCCDVIDCDTTVECIAQHIAKALKAEEPTASFMVKAYEGVQKGAIAEI